MYADVLSQPAILPTFLTQWEAYTADRYLDLKQIGLKGAEVGTGEAGSIGTIENGSSELPQEFEAVFLGYSNDFSGRTHIASQRAQTNDRRVLTEVEVLIKYAGRLEVERKLPLPDMKNIRIGVDKVLKAQEKNQTKATLQKPKPIVVHPVPVPGANANTGPTGGKAKRATESSITVPAWASEDDDSDFDPAPIASRPSNSTNLPKPFPQPG